MEIRTKKDFERHYYALKNVLGSLQLMTYLEQKQIISLFAVFPNLVIYHEFRDFGHSLRDKISGPVTSHEPPKRSP